ncbi:MAG: 50S ribosomal protein L11 methyltransferase [Deltaproteobacteria bacterium]|nr:50S ribosomal protein L11 methyltransferase [Deltaproteobacteria bacterium]
MTRWKSFTVETRQEAVDALSHFFMGRGSLGMAYDERRFGPNGDPADPLPPPDEVTKLTAYFPWEADLHELKKAFLEYLPVLEESFGKDAGAFVSAAEISDFGWAEKWKEFFLPRKVGSRLVVRPSWEPYEAAPDEVVLTIDPGQAFGTGTHETTRLCMQFLEEVFGSGVPHGRVLDVGTGTGILGIAALRLGADCALGIDTDPKAVEVAEENAKINGVADRFAATFRPLSAAEGTFDVVIANILAEILIDMKGEIAARCAPGGLMILSGILDEKGDWVEEEFRSEGARPVGRKTDGQWTALLLRREGN